MYLAHLKQAWAKKNCLALKRETLSFYPGKESESAQNKAILFGFLRFHAGIKYFLQNGPLYEVEIDSYGPSKMT